MIKLNKSFKLIQKKSESFGVYKVIVFSLVFFLCSVTIFSSCENPITGYGPQPRYIEKPGFKPMLNILGILRPDTVLGLPQSFVHLEESYPFNEFPDSTIITDAQVIIYEYKGTTVVDSMRLTYSNYKAHFQTWEYRDSTFLPKAGVTYSVSCQREGFPKLRGLTCIPQIPVVVNNSLQITLEQLCFTIKRDSLVALYDIYFLVGSRIYQTRIRRPEIGDVEVVIELDDVQADNGELLVYGYDLNLSEYITYNISIKPNTYRVPYSTVEDGYGCFGSLNVYKKTINF